MHACKLSQIFQLEFFFSRSKELQSKPASQHLIERRTANYGAPSASDSNAVDLHNKEFCVDVSTYLPVEWQEVEAEQCDTVFVKQCEDREEDVCAEVTETRCQVRTWLGVKYRKTTSHINIRLPLTCSDFFLSKILVNEHLSSFFKQPKTHQKTVFTKIYVKLVVIAAVYVCLVG